MTGLRPKPEGVRAAGAQAPARAGGTIVFVLLAAALATGCCPPEPETVLLREQLVDAHNRRAAFVPRLWARASIQLKLVDAETGRFVLWSSGGPTGLLLLKKQADPSQPPDFVLIGKEVGEEIFRVGYSARDRAAYYWFHYGGEGGGAYLPDGAEARAAGRALPIDPLELVSALQVCAWPRQPGRLPAVAMRLDGSDCFRRAYVMDYIDAGARYKRSTRLHWDDEKPARAFAVEYFSPLGRPAAMTARVGDWKGIRLEDLDAYPEGEIEMPTDIEIRWAETGSWIRLRLSEMTTADKFLVEVFRLFDRLPPGLRGRLRRLGDAQEAGS
jgi:hypothetical protein